MPSHFHLTYYYYIKKKICYWDTIKGSLKAFQASVKTQYFSVFPITWQNIVQQCQNNALTQFSSNKLKQNLPFPPKKILVSCKLILRTIYSTKRSKQTQTPFLLCTHIILFSLPLRSQYPSSFSTFLCCIFHYPVHLQNFYDPCWDSWTLTVIYDACLGLYLCLLGGHLLVKRKKLL